MQYTRGLYVKTRHVWFETAVVVEFTCWSLEIDS